MFLPQTKKQWLVLVLVLIGTIAIWNRLVYQLEMQNLFHPNITDYPNPTQALIHNPLRSKVQDVNFKAKDGTQLDAWYVPAKANCPTIIFAHGNAGNIADRSHVVDLFTKAGYGFLAFDYRGYGKSEGVPSEQGLYQDLEAASHYLENVKQIPLSQQIALGGSLGSSVVIDVATRLHFRAVVIYAVLTSAPDVAEYLYQKTNWRFFPIKNMMQQRFDSLSKVQKVRSPLIIMHGTTDHMMPLWMPKALLSKAKVPYKQLLIIPNAGHNDVLELGIDQLLKQLHQLLLETKPT